MRDDLEQRLGIQVALVKRLAHAEERLDVVTRDDEIVRRGVGTDQIHARDVRFTICI